MTIVSGTAYPNLVVKGALGPRTQADVLFTGEAQVDLATLPANSNDTVFYGPDGLLIYDTPQDAAAIILINEVIGVT
jgi:hypothetical protein